MIKKTTEWLKGKSIFSKKSCYERGEKIGYASMGCCGGLAGGDKTTLYLQYGCIDCPYFCESYSVCVGRSRDKEEGEEE